MALLHTNRVPQELGYHEDFLAIEAAGKIGLLYVPTVRRPGEQAIADGRVGQDWVNNVFRDVFGLPTREEEKLDEADRGGAAGARASAAGAVRPMLPVHIGPSAFRSRLQAPRTVLLACGNPAMIADIRRVADRLGIPCEAEEW